MKLRMWLPIVLVSVLSAKEDLVDLKDIIGNQKQFVLDNKVDYYKALDSKNKTSWISDINVQMSDSYRQDDLSSRTFSASYRQPIYMGGNIINTILSSKKQRDINLSIVSKERDQIIYEVMRKVLFIKRMELRKRTILLSLKANEINLSRKKDLYRDGMLDITFVSDMIINQNNIKNQHIDIKNTIEILKKELRLFSTIPYEDLSQSKELMSYIKLIPKDEFMAENYLNINKEQLSLVGMDTKMAKNKFLPTVSINVNAYDETKDSPLGSSNDNGYYGGFSVSMPLSVNNYKNMQLLKVKELMETNVYADKVQTEGVFYDNKVKEVEVIGEKVKNIEQAIVEYDQLIEILEKDLTLGLGVKYDLTILKINRDLKISEKSEQINIMKEKILEIVSHTRLKD